jgi:hypothetical protein
MVASSPLFSTETMTAKPALLHFMFKNFSKFPTEIGVCIYSNEQTDCNGNRWILQLFPAK